MVCFCSVVHRLSGNVQFIKEIFFERFPSRSDMVIFVNKTKCMAKDRFHFIVKEALTRDGWKITHDPYPLKDWDPDWEVDFGAEKIIAAEKGMEKIAIEVKTFLEMSFAYEFHKVLGQYLNYRAGLSQLEIDRILYLAVPVGIWETEFQRRGIQFSVKEYNVRILVFNPITSSIEIWIP